MRVESSSSAAEQIRQSLETGQYFSVKHDGGFGLGTSGEGRVWGAGCGAM